MAAKKQAAVIAPTCDVVEINGFLVGRMTEKARIFIVWDAAEGVAVAKFGLHKGNVQVWTREFGDVISPDAIADDDGDGIAADYYAERDRKRAEAAKAKKAKTNSKAPQKTVALRKKVEAQLEMVN